MVNMPFKIYAEICKKYAVPNMQEIYTNMHMQMKNMYSMCKTSNIHKYASYMHIHVFYV